MITRSLAWLRINARRVTAKLERVRIPDNEWVGLMIVAWLVIAAILTWMFYP